MQFWGFVLWVVLPFIFIEKSVKPDTEFNEKLQYTENTSLGFDTTKQHVLLMSGTYILE